MMKQVWKPKSRYAIGYLFRSANVFFDFIELMKRGNILDADIKYQAIINGNDEILTENDIEKINDTINDVFIKDFVMIERSEAEDEEHYSFALMAEKIVKVLMGDDYVPIKSNLDC